MDFMNALSIPIDAIVNLYDDLARRESPNRCFLRNWAAFPRRYRKRLRVPSRNLDHTCPTSREVFIDLGSVRQRPENATVQELYCLSVLARMSGASRIFEFGTFDGQTTLQLTRACPAATVYTLDLPPREGPQSGGDDAACETAPRGVGCRFAGRDEASRIRQLFGDSMAFDFTPFQGGIGFVFVDACHEYEAVKCDTRNAYSMVRHGIIAWHDYDLMWPGVVRALEELPRRPSLTHIAGTSLVFDVIGDVSVGLS